MMEHDERTLFHLSQPRSLVREYHSQALLAFPTTSKQIRREETFQDWLHLHSTDTNNIVSEMDCLTPFAMMKD